MSSENCLLRRLKRSRCTRRTWRPRGGLLRGITWLVLLSTFVQTPLSYAHELPRPVADRDPVEILPLEGTGLEDPFDFEAENMPSGSLGAIEKEGAFLPEIDPARAKKAEEFVSNQVQILDEVLEIQSQYGGYLAKMRDLWLAPDSEQTPRIFIEDTALASLRTQGESGFHELMEMGTPLKYEVPGLGKAEIFKIDGSFFTKVVHQKTGIAFLFLDKEKVSAASKHFKKYMGRQHLEAGENGRDVFIVWTDSSGDVEAEWSPKPKWTKWDWWKDFWHATYVKPKKADLVLATFCSAAQSCLALAAAGADKALNGHPLDTKAAVLSAVWAFGIGSYISTYKNWVNRGSKMQRTMKALVNGGLFNYSLDIWHGHALRSIHLQDVGGLIMHADHKKIFGNLFFSNWAKDSWNELSRIREGTRKYVGPMNIKVPGLKILNGVKRQSLEYQTIYLIPFTIKLLDMIDFKVSLPVVGDAKIGKLMLWLSVPFAAWLAQWYARRLGYERAQKLQAEFKDLMTLGFLRRLPGRVGSVVFRGFKFVQNSCEALLVPKDQRPEPKAASEDSRSP